MDGKYRYFESLFGKKATAFQISDWIFRPPFINSKASGFRFSILGKKRRLPPVFESKCPFSLPSFSFTSFVKRIHQGSPGVTKRGSLGFPWVPAVKHH